MFKWPMWAAAIAVAVGSQPAAAGEQEIETIFAIPSQALTLATHYVAHDAGFFKKEGVKVADRYLVGVASPNAEGEPGRQAARPQGRADAIAPSAHCT